MIQVELNGKLTEVTKHQLFALAARGTIGPQTRLIFNGKESTVGKVNGIVFGQPQTDGPVPVPSVLVNPPAVSVSPVPALSSSVSSISVLPIPTNNFNLRKTIACLGLVLCLCGFLMGCWYQYLLQDYYDSSPSSKLVEIEKDIDRYRAEIDCYKNENWTGSSIEVSQIEWKLEQAEQLCEKLEQDQRDVRERYGCSIAPPPLYFSLSFCGVIALWLFGILGLLVGFVSWSISFDIGIVTVKTIDTYFRRFSMFTVAAVLLLFFAIALLPVICFLAPYREEDFVYVLLCFTGIFAGLVALLEIAGLIYKMKFLYQLWALIPPDIVRTTPGYAVGFNFIPFFTYYWQFIAYWGLGNDLNKALQRQGIPYQVNSSLGLGLCITHCGILVFPGVGILLALVGEIITIFFLKSAKDGAIALLNQGETKP